MQQEIFSKDSIECSAALSALPVQCITSVGTTCQPLCQTAIGNTYKECAGQTVRSWSKYDIAWDVIFLTQLDNFDPEEAVPFSSQFVIMFLSLGQALGSTAVNTCDLCPEGCTANQCTIDFHLLSGWSSPSLACFDSQSRFFSKNLNVTLGPDDEPVVPCDQEAEARLEQSCNGVCVGNDLPTFVMPLSCAANGFNCKFSVVESSESQCNALHQECLSEANAIGYAWTLSFSLFAVLLAQR